MECMHKMVGFDRGLRRISFSSVLVIGLQVNIQVQHSVWEARSWRSSFSRP